MKRNLANTSFTLILLLGAFSIILPTGYARATTFIVDCDAVPVPEEIQVALDATAEGDVIEVSGTCNEGVSIRKDRIRLDGLGGAKIIVPSGTGKTAVSIRGNFVTIARFSAIIGDRHGIFIEGSNATIQDNTIKDSPRLAIIMLSNNSATIVDNVLTNNVGGGIRVSRGANATIRGNEITGNAGRGIQLTDVASGEISSNTITDNGSHGISVRGNATARLSGGPTGSGNPNVIERNGRSGLSCGAGGSLDIDTAQVFGTGDDANATGDTSITETCVIRGDAAESLAEFKPEKIIKK